MRFQLTEDQLALKAGVRELLDRRFGRDALRAAVDAPGRLDRELWRALGDAGFFALRLPEAHGGVGLGLPEAVLVFEEAGRALLPGPLVATHLAAGSVPGAATGETVVAAVDGKLVEWLAAADVVRGEAAKAVPLRSLDPLTPLHRIPTACAAAPTAGSDSAAAAGSCAVGSAPIQQSASAAAAGSRAAEAAPTRQSASAAAAGSRTAGAVAVPQEAGPRQRGQAAHPPACSGTGAQDPDGTHTGAADPVGTRTPDPVARLLTAAEQLGTAVRVQELAVQHARTREQFGQPIGAFQAVKHLCADLLVRAETARVAVYAAAVTGDPADIAAARLLADEAAVRGARDCLQVHGGMGFTWEADVHLHLKRAWVRAQRGGGSTESEELLAARLVA
ncbi:acyl-CoA dehydrogenase family protein [Streptomyces sp. NPDC001709]